MFCGRRSLTSRLIQVLVCLGLIPGGKSKLLDWCRGMFWFMINIALVSLSFYLNRNGYVAFVSEVRFQYALELAFGLIWSLQNAAVSFCLSVPWKTFPQLTQNDRLRVPKALPAFLMIILILLGTYLSLLINFRIISVYQFNFVLLQAVQLFVLGVCFANLSKSEDVDEQVFDIKSALKVAKAKISNFKLLKTYSSPHFLVIIVPHGVDMITMSWSVFSNHYDHIYECLLTILSSMTTITYACYIANNCYVNYKNDILIFR